MNDERDKVGLPEMVYRAQPSSWEIDRGPKPGNLVPWSGFQWGSHLSVVADSPTGGGAEVVVEPAVPGPNDRANLGAIVHRVNTYDAICDRAEKAESALRAVVQAAESGHFGGLFEQCETSALPLESRRYEQCSLGAARYEELNGVLVDFDNWKGPVTP